jgi:hypothetical protein
MLVSGLRMFLPRFAMFVSGLGMRLRLILLANLVMMGGLMMMVGRSVMKSGGLMMMLNSRMLRRLCHAVFLPNQLANDGRLRRGH